MFYFGFSQYECNIKSPEALVVLVRPFTAYLGVSPEFASVPQTTEKVFYHFALLSEGVFNLLDFMLGSPGTCRLRAYTFIASAAEIFYPKP